MRNTEKITAYLVLGDVKMTNVRVPLVATGIEKMRHVGIKPIIFVCRFGYCFAQIFHFALFGFLGFNGSEDGFH